MSAVNYAELDQLMGELLPERTVLGVITPMGAGDGGAGAGAGAGAAASGGAVFVPPGGGTVVSACQSVVPSPPSPTLLGALGLGTTQPTPTTFTCVPAAVTH